MQILLRLKHWQIFILTAGTYASVFFIPLLLLNFSSIINMKVFPVLVFFSHVVRSLWQLTMAQELHRKIPEGVTINIGLFLVVFYVHFSYTVIVSFVSIASMFVDLPEFVENIYDNVTFTRLWLWPVNITLGIYFSYVISMLLSTVERKERWVNIGDLILLIFFPIGIWWIQPRVNKIFFNENEFDPNTPLDQNIN